MGETETTQPVEASYWLGFQELPLHNVLTIIMPKNMLWIYIAIDLVQESNTIVIGEGQKVGSFFQGDLNRAGKVKVDNFLALEDLDMDSDEETKPQMSKDLLLPGEVEEEVSTFTPSCVLPVARPLSPEVKPKPTVKGTDTRDETLGDEVQPFSLDEEFDYDSVTLTPKFPAAEMEMLRELSKQRRENNTDSERPCD
ncbi:hypothetical protein TREES_T100003564 [Tupaia chinensis]|uniref:Uncharacterized protein n=1 Tax=Tupaia chinensis TaxID=246437 RepID=L8Y6U9_TUPCH|nr:hypothetical protein TREES_T100003564 [Tupaia chinensis]